MRLLLSQAAAVPAVSAALLRTRRLLPQTVLPLSTTVLAGVVHVRRTQLHADEQIAQRAAKTFPNVVVSRSSLEGVIVSRHFLEGVTQDRRKSLFFRRRHGKMGC
jgi:hypothetical protein